MVQTWMPVTAFEALREMAMPYSLREKLLEFIDEDVYKRPSAIALVCKRTSSVGCIA